MYRRKISLDNPARVVHAKYEIWFSMVGLEGRDVSPDHETVIAPFS